MPNLVVLVQTVRALLSRSVSSHVDDVLVKTPPDLNQPLFQFMNAVDVCMVNTFLNDRPYLIVNCVEA